MWRARAPPRAMLALVLATAAAAVAGAVGAADHTDDDILYNITEEEYFSMPLLFELDEWSGCAASRGVYCLGTFELQPAEGATYEQRRRFRDMQRYSNNWVDNYNHTRVHRGLCLSRRCAHLAPAHHAHAHAHAHAQHNESDAAHPHQPALEAWFVSCVNASTVSSHGLVSRLLGGRAAYCTRGPSGGGGGGGGAAGEEPLSGAQRAFAGLVAALAALAALSTTLDATLPAHAKKGARLQWALSWSLGACWRDLHAQPQAALGQGPGHAQGPGPGGPGPEGDLRVLDGLRVMCMACVIIEHVAWLATQSYLANVWQYEQMRRAADVMLMTNSTLVVQIFFLMSSFLLAHKLLLQQRRGAALAPWRTFADTMLNRIIRVSPSYFVVVLFAGSWWARLGSGPLWAPLVGAEAAVCRRKWWTHLLYLNNVLYADDKCLIQTWYLAADMQLYACALALTLALCRLRASAGALYALAALLLAAIALPFGMAYAWHLVPTFVMHRPELVRNIYSGESSFNVLYQSPVSNAAGALAGLLLAHAHHALLDRGVRLQDCKVFCWVSALSPLLAAWWAGASPALLGRGPPARGAAAALAALERPVFSLFVAVAMLGAMHGVKSPLRSVLCWRGWATPARLSFGVLLLHMPFNKALVAARLTPTQIDRQVALVESFGVALMSYLCALPLALLVELPAQRLHRALRRTPPRPGAAPQGSGPRPTGAAAGQDSRAQADAPLHKTDL